jgi:hypothetical protein
MNLVTSQYLVDILNTRMGLTADTPNSAVVRDQNFKAPNTPGIFIVVGSMGPQPISAVTYMKTGNPITWDQNGQTFDAQGQTYDQTTGNPITWDQNGQTFDAQGQTYDQTVESEIEVNEVQLAEQIQIDVMSRDNSAIMRSFEVVAALNSFYSKQQQELYSFKISRLPHSMINTSAAEGPAQYNRYTLTFTVFSWYRTESVIMPAPGYGPYFDDFSVRADDDASIGTDKPIVEFEINQEGIEP